MSFIFAERHERAVTALFAGALFLSAFLLFSLQPIVAKVLLPKLGGSPVVWNTCMVFFQATLLAGYGAAHFACAGRLSQRLVWLYPVFLVAGAVALPLTFARAPENTVEPVVWLLGELAREGGLPVLALAMSAPLLQVMFSTMPLRGARDPYFLYAASNAGSLLALLLYPSVIEPQIGLQRQSALWAMLYIAVILSAGACVFVARKGRGVGAGGPSAPRSEPRHSPSIWLQRLRWTALAFIPSSLMLGVTTHISTDVAAVPLIWIVPLALYLVTFMVAFGRRSTERIWTDRYVPLLVVAVAFELIVGASINLFVGIALHLATFMAVGMLCHCRLADERPEPARLTEFYFLLSLGGVAGGVFNALLAPLLFSSPAEYIIVLVIASAVPALRWTGSLKVASRDVVVALTVGAAFALLDPTMKSSGNITPFGYAVVGLFMAVTFSQSKRLIRFPVMLAALLLVAHWWGTSSEMVVHAERTFFGSYRVTEKRAAKLRELKHGTTVHGMQWLDQSRQYEPLSYYHRGGPFGQAFELLPVMHNAANAAVVGLGTGSLAAYSSANTAWTFYEIDPAVERIARDPRYFDFLQRCDTRCKVVLGDARLSLARSGARYNFIVLDAFSSDAIPMHLVTREAVEVYLRHLVPDGVLCIASLLA